MLHPGKFLVAEKDWPRLPPPALAALRRWGDGLLQPGGALVMKILEGSGTKEFADSLRPAFDKARGPAQLASCFKPMS